jgi:alanine racemase
MEHSLSWVEISADALRHNIGVMRSLIGHDRIMCPAIKSNAYGHGMVECAGIMANAGADWLGVNALFEAVDLREAGITAPVYIMGYISLNELEIAVENGFHFVVYNRETMEHLNTVCGRLQKPALTHIKVETGNNRQGILKRDVNSFLDFYKNNPLIKLEGVTTHFANIEDTVDHSYADAQLNKFKTIIDEIKSHGFTPAHIHCANTAATILFPDTYFNMVRTGIGNYGLWPSNETLISARHEGKNIELKPVLSWKTRIAQIKDVPEGEFIGYGCTYKATRDIKLAILPVGYYDGYDRRMSNRAYVLIGGQRAPVRGRVCMNICMADVTDIPTAKLEDEVVLLGCQGEENLSAEQLAMWSESINYETTTKINGKLKRVVV